MGQGGDGPREKRGGGSSAPATAPWWRCGPRAARPDSTTEADCGPGRLRELSQLWNNLSQWPPSTFRASKPCSPHTRRPRDARRRFQATAVPQRHREAQQPAPGHTARSLARSPLKPRCHALHGGRPSPAHDSPSSALCCGVTASSLLASLAMERVIRPLRLPWLLAVFRPLEATASFSSLSSPEVSSVFSLEASEGDRDDFA